jgi:hypothetical protein
MMTQLKYWEAGWIVRHWKQVCTEGRRALETGKGDSRWQRRQLLAGEAGVERQVFGGRLW